MCYTGKCPYEYSVGEAAGECRLRDDDSMPDDAYCVLTDKRIEEWERMHPISTLYGRAKLDAALSSVQDEILF